MAKASARTKTQRPHAVHVEVLQNGARVAEYQKRASKISTLALTSQPSGELSLPFYPLPANRHEFLRRDAAGTWLLVDHRWDGFCTSRGELISIARGERGRREVLLHPGDYGSISFEDLRILVKIAPESAPAKAARRTRAKESKFYARPALGLFALSQDERRSFGVGTIMAAVIVGGFVFGLLKRVHHRPERLDDIPQQYMISFISPDHLRHGPEALQGDLDRRNLARSVIGYYRSLSELMLGRDGYDPRLLPQQSIAMYEGLFADARHRAAESTTRQRLTDESIAKQPDAAIVRIPAVIGESIDGGTLRVIDKIKILQAGFEMVLDERRRFIEEFPRDPDYDFEQYKAVSGKDQRATEYLSKIKPWGRFTNEEMMYEEAARLAGQAQLRRDRLAAGSPESRVATAALPPPIGLPVGTRFASFLGGNPQSDAFSDERLYQLQGIPYGTRNQGRAVAAKDSDPGEIDPSLVENFIKQNRFQLQLCYELALRRDELATGMMVWSWRIDARGSISDVSLVSSSIKDPKMTQCIKQKISTWRFPRPRRGSVEVRFPFEFAPNKG